MPSAFVHHLQTGSGWTKCDLIFVDDVNARIELNSSWMGSGSIRFRLSCRRQVFSQYYGLLYVNQIESYPSVSADDTEIINIRDLMGDPEFYDELHDPHPSEFFVFEYIKMPEPEIWVADDRGLQELQHFFDLAKWNETFSLILLYHSELFFTDDAFEATTLWKAIQLMTKMKFTEVA
ncbi:MAG: hypothetical protein K8L91_02415 [Anaerolineae bacterium]|nr:hypothetical protein [Anaerolineae bacterium]